MAKRLWPFLLASTVSLIPFTVFGMYLVPIAATANGSVAEIGGLRGLGGLAALIVGIALAPLVDRLARELVAAGGLALLGLSAALGAIGNVFALAAFCLLIGASTSILAPSIGAAAADRFNSPAAAGRAAALVSATTSMMAMLAAPVLAVPGLFWGWRGNLLAGRYLASDRPWISSEKMLLLGLSLALLSVAAFYFAPTLPLTLLLTSFMGAAHATVAACVTTLLVRRSGDLRGSALSVNAAGMSLGTFLGAAIGGAGLGIGGYPGLALMFASITLIGFLLALRVRPAA
jgi:predicted MFS family arabinose efflux permease